MNKDKHIIHRVNLEIDAPDPKTARQVQDDALRILKNDILPALEKYLDNVEEQPQSIRFNQLYLNLDDLASEDFEAEFAIALLGKFRDQIDKIIDPQTVSKADDDEPVTKFTKDESDLERFLFFLRTGRLPWWSSRDETFASEPEILKNPLWKDQSYRRRLLMLLFTNDHAFERLLLQFQDEFAVKLIVSAVSGKHPETVNAARMLKEIETSGMKLSEKLRSVIAEFDRTSADSDAEMRKAKPKKNIDQVLTDQDQEKETETPVEGLFVVHAGLVLLHPFLEYFFMEFNLLKDQKFVNKKARTTAIHLMYYLATGQENPMEYELLFEKYLCGWDLDEPVPCRVKLSKNMKTESEKLLNSAIGHWKALKKTSPAGLREGFLQREGKLVLGDFQHRLIVEGNTTDVLLSSLPWGYGMIKLPWLEQVLIVDWDH